jgi:hypothetical protein
MKILDLFSGIGGSAIGIHKAFPDAEIVGIDINDYTNQYPFEFIQCDITKIRIEFINQFDFIWASPPCHHYSFSTRKAVNIEKKEYPDLIGFTRDLLLQTKKPFIIENVIGSPLINPIILYGDMFGLPIKRPRKFELHGFSIPKDKIPKRDRSLPNYRLISGGGGWIKGNEIGKVHRMAIEQAIELFEIKPKTMKEASQIIPYHYSQFLCSFLDHFF